MIKNHSAGLHKGIYNLLNRTRPVMYAASGSSSKKVPVYERFPSNKPFPYIIVAEDIVNQDDTKDTSRSEIYKTIDVYAGGKSRRQVDSICKSIKALLENGQSLINTGNEGNVTVLDQNSMRVMAEDGDPVVWHGILTYRAIITD